MRRRVRVVKPGWVKRGRQRAHFPVNHLIGHDFSSGRSEQYAIPVVAERSEDAGDRSLADQRLIVRAAGANTSPCGQFRRISQGWHERGGAGAELGDGVAVDLSVSAVSLRGGADEDPAGFRGDVHISRVDDVAGALFDRGERAVLALPRDGRRRAERQSRSAGAGQTRARPGPGCRAPVFEVARKRFAGGVWAVAAGPGGKPSE